jgi:hypothetical protein
MLSSDLKHGDVLAYTHRNNNSLLVECIHLVEGSDYTHAAIVMKYNQKFILEQRTLRMHSYLPLYYALPNEYIYCFRPKFTPHKATFEEFNRKSYGVLGIINSAVKPLVSAMGDIRHNLPTIIPLIRMLK